MGPDAGRDHKQTACRFAALSPASYVGPVKSVFVATALLLMSAASAHATVFVVYPNDSTFIIQDAIDAASYGDTIQLAPGNHFYWVPHGEVHGWDTRAVAFLKDGITIESQAGPENTVIDCETTTARHGFVGENLGPNTVIRGITFVDCEDSGFSGNGKWGGGILLYDSAAVIENCWFARCNADGGGAVFLHGGVGGILKNCLFYDNVAGELGGAVELYLTSGSIIENCTFARNSAEEAGGALLVNSSSVSLSQCLLWRNRTEDVGGAVMCLNSGLISPTCNLFWGNTRPSTSGPEEFPRVPDHVSGCSSFGDLYIADPLFCDPDADNFYVMSSSPCLPANSPCGSLIGAFEEGCAAVSAPEYEVKSWGRIKELYR